MPVLGVGACPIHKEQNDRSLDEKEIAKEKKKETPEILLQIDSSGSYTITW